MELHKRILGDHHLLLISDGEFETILDGLDSIISESSEFLTGSKGWAEAFLNALALRSALEPRLSDRD